METFANQGFLCRIIEALQQDISRLEEQELKATKNLESEKTLTASLQHQEHNYVIRLQPVLQSIFLKLLAKSFNQMIISVDPD